MPGASVFAIDAFGSSVLNIAEMVMPRTSHMQRVISIIKSLSEADTRKAHLEAMDRSRSDIGQAGAEHEYSVSKSYSNNKSPDSEKSRRRSKAQEIKRLAEVKAFFKIIIHTFHFFLPFLERATASVRARR